MKFEMIGINLQVNFNLNFRSKFKLNLLFRLNDSNSRGAAAQTAIIRWYVLPWQVE